MALSGPQSRLEPLIDPLLLVLSVLVCLSVVGTRTAARWGVPALVIFVGLGMLAGSSGPGGIPFADYGLAYRVGTLALAVILFSGGLNTDASRMRRALAPALALSTVGVLTKMLTMAALARWLTPLDWSSALLLGAVLAPTDAAAVFSVLRRAGLPTRLRSLLEAESGTNDPMSIYLTLALATALTGGEVSIPHLLLGVAAQLGLGLCVGLAGGWGLAWTLRRLRLEGSGLYPVFALAGGVGLFALTNLLGGNGFLAIYVTGLLLRYRKVAYLHEIQTALDTLAWGAQIGMFLLLGLLSFPDRLMGALGPSTLLAAGMVLLARPLSVAVAVLPLWPFAQHRYSLRELTLVSWAGLKGAVPIILATVPLLKGVPAGEQIFDVVFVVVIVGALVQGTTTVPLARALGLTHPEPPSAPVTLDLGGDAPAGSAMTRVWLEPGAPAIGRSVRELGLDEAVVLAAVARGGEMLAPRGNLVLRQGDHVFVMTVDGAAIPQVLQA